LAGQPSGSDADYQDDCETLARHVHVPILFEEAGSIRSLAEET
jgi:hypothetical protein